MMRTLRWPALGLVAVIGLVAGFFVFVAPEPPPLPRPPVEHPRTLVALGDSTVSGEGARGYEPGTDGEGGNWCHRSGAAAINHTGLDGVERVENLACSGANSAQVGLGDVEQYGEPSQARRLGEVARRTRVVAVVVAVGANDDPGFSHLLNECVQAWVDNARDGCARASGAQWRSKVEAMVPKARKALGDIRSVMRNAGYSDGDYQFVLQSYAAPVGPDTRPELRNLNGCPFREDDLLWVRESAVPTITDGVRRVARESGVRFLDLSRAGVGREACSRGDAAQEWFTRLSVRWSDLGKDGRAEHALQESFHPSAAGHAALGACLGEFLATTDRAAACLVGADGRLRPATSAGP